MAQMHPLPNTIKEYFTPVWLGLIAQVIAAEGEQKASRALREAADVIAESSSALQVSI